ncbi:MAG TPA: cyclic nucleotide-binding domain-containing protein [Gammaproteobacteria bacterium]|nr:cyclic nucleotide-binding domain-containing protein [Gammaproteobacteria bacterium]
MSEQATVDLIEFSSLVPIKALGMEHCRELLAQSEVVAFAKGTIIFEQGDVSQSIVYVMSGDVELLVDGQVEKHIRGGTRLAKLPLEQAEQCQHTARALTDVVCVRVDQNALDIMLTWDQSGGYEVQELDESVRAEDDDDGDWMARLLQAKVFHRIPPANIQSIFMSMVTEHFSAGESVIRQGEEGEHFYIIREGQCEVSRKTRKNPEGMVLATLSVGDNFGEEALISGGKRNASVTMLTDGVLMSLSKADFLELLNEPLLKWVSFREGSELAADGAVWIDVRLPAEYKARHIRKSINIPLPLLRTKLEKLDPERRYLLYCDSGRRASIATYLLSQEGFDAFVLLDSLDNLPDVEME